MDSATNSSFEAEIARYNGWREDLVRSVETYHNWLEQSGQLDVQQSIRFYDLLETLNKGRLLLAFLAEFSRGKSELINAMFFSSFKERLLPSDVGRTTMCPTEIFHDPNEGPYLKLLSVETRYRDESISQLKNMPVEWSKIRLNTESAKDMRQALMSLADTKRVYALDARMMGLIPMFDDGTGPKEDEIVEVPAWRYAIINYPHPLLTNGLSILDTPGLNALGLEPELTLSTIPNAHAVLFLLGMDTGVTKSDLEIWERYVKTGMPAKMAVLNKIDLMWDELKTEPEIQASMDRMIQSTSRQLGLPVERVFAVSAQKALIGRIKNDAAMINRSGIERLERFLADEIIPIRRQILARSVTNEIGGMMVASHRSCAQKLAANTAQMDELQNLSGKGRDVAQKLWEKVTAEKEVYTLALAEYKTHKAEFNKQRSALLDLLNPAKIDVMCARSMQAMEDSWYTRGLTRGMKSLITLMEQEFNVISEVASHSQAYMQDSYTTFHARFGFEKTQIPKLDLEMARTKLKLLVFETEQFCNDPVNLYGTEKKWMIRRFWRMLVEEARQIFADARAETDRWLNETPLRLETQMKDHKVHLQQRLDSMASLNARTENIDGELRKLINQRKVVQDQATMITDLIVKLRETAPPKS